jgi:hypothetical protein
MLTTAYASRYRRLLWAVTLGILAVPAVASAQLREDAEVVSDRPFWSKRDRRRVMFELKFGPYTPAVDRAVPGGKTPYADTFGNLPQLMTQLEVDLELFHFRHVGTLGVGFTWGYWQNSANAFNVDMSGARVQDTTTFTVMPLIPQIVYRYDVLAMRTKIPIVPYAKVGLAYYLYWIRDGNGAVSNCKDPLACLRVDNGKGAGGIYGFTVNVGAAFLLDFVDRATARIAKHEVGLYHTYVFAEFNLAVINDFGKSDTLNLSSETFLAGIAFEF